MTFRTIIPNVFTALNLLSGFAAIMIMLVGEKMEYAFLAIIVAAVFDVLDGLLARLLKGTSDFGRQFDSMADLISFGFAPAFLMLHTTFFLQFSENLNEIVIGVLPSAIFLLAVSIRLAWFNADKSQTNDFRGLASPGAALALTALMFDYQSWFYEAEYNMLYIAFLFAALMLVPVRVMSLKVSGSKWHKIFVLVMILVSVVLLILRSPESLWIIVLVYYLAGILMYQLSQKFNKPKVNV